MTDRELVYLYRTENIEEARRVLEMRYFNKLNYYLVHLKNSRFFNCPLESSDIKSMAYMAFLQAIKTFDLKQYNYDFAQSLMTYSRSYVMRQLHGTIGPKHAILNSCLCSNDEYDTMTHSHTYDGEGEMIDAISAEEKMRLVYEFADRYH
jgi:hypothetical protein